MNWTPNSGERPWPPGPSEMAARVREHDWAATPLGPIERWPQCLRTAVELLIENRQACYLAWGPELISIYNDGYVPILEGRHPDGLGLPYPKLWPEIWDEFRPVVEAVHRGEAQHFVDRPVPLAHRPDRPISWFTFSWTPLRYSDGEVGGIFCLASETTELVLATDSLRESEARYRTLFEAIDAGFCTFDMIFDAAGRAIDYRFVQTNPSFERQSGLVGAVGRRVREFAPDLEEVWLERYGRVALTGEALRVEGEVSQMGRWFDINAFRVGQPEQRRVAVLFTDITARRQAAAALLESEQQFGSLFDQAPLGVYLIDSDFVIQKVNPVALPAFGDLPGGPVGRDFAEVIRILWAKDYADEIVGIFRRTLETGESYVTAERAEYRSDRAVIEYYQWRVDRIPLPGGRHGAVAYFSDISAQVMARKEIEAARKLARESEARQAFLLRLSDALRAEPSAEAKTDLALRMLSEQMRLDRCYVGVYRLAEDTGEFPHQVYADALPPLPAQVRLSDFPAALDIAMDRTRVIDDVAELDGLSAGERASFDGLGLRAVIAATLRKGENAPLWSLVAASKRPRAWTQGDVALVEEVAERTWAAAERARAEAASHDSEERFRLILESALDYVIATTDGNGVITAWSPGAEAVLGWSAQDAVGLNLEMIYAPEERAAGRPERERVQALATGRAANVCWHLRKDGSRVHLDEVVRPLRKAGERVAFLKVGRDSTDRLRAEDAVRASEARFRSFAENTADVLWIVDAATHQLEYLSPAFETMWGETRERVMTDLSRWAELLHPDDRERALAGMPRLLAGETMQQQYRIVRPSDGATRWILDTGFPIVDAHGRVVRVGGIAQDMTRRIVAEQRVAESERRLRSLMEGVPQLIWRAAEDGRRTWSSPQWTDYTEQSQIDSLGRGWLNVVHPDDRAAAAEAWDRAQETQALEADYRVRCAAGDEWRWFQTRAAPVRDETGHVVEWLGASTDVHDLRGLQEHQKLLLLELQHRVRNTLGVLRSIARRTADTSETVEEFGQHLDGRINAFARTQAIVTRDPAAGVDFGFLVAEELRAHGAQEGEQALVEGPPIALQPKAAETLGLALHELATNAVKYGSLGDAGGRVDARWRVESGERPTPTLVFDWLESGASRPVTPPFRKGFGTELLERTLKFELKAFTSLDFAPDGLRCRLEIPLTDKVVVRV